MKRTLALLSPILLLLACGPTKTIAPQPTVIGPADPVELANTITEEELKEMLYVYASDEFEGRATGEPGQKKAVAYLRDHYIDLEIPSPLGGDDYYHEVPLQKNKAPKMTMTINDVVLESGTNFVSLMTSSDGIVKQTQIVDAGYGIEMEGYSDYQDIDVSGKVIFIRSGEPKNADGTYVITGTEETSRWSNMRQQFAAKRDLAQEKGAKVVLFYYPEIYDMVAPRFSSSSGRLALGGETDSMYLLLANSDLAEAVFNGNTDAIDDYKGSKAHDASFAFSFTNESEPVESENVIAYIKGTEKPDEYVIITAHLDHVGVQEGKIYNGADDDGSGTVAILEIAEAFKMAADRGQGPKRSVVFLHVTGEERGLLGSRYYTDMDPVFPLENTVANLNIDMIGRTDPKREGGDRNYVYLIGSDKLSTDLHNLSEEVNSKYTQIELDYKFNDDNDPNRFYYRSDHYNFAKNNVPIIFYFNGTHADYHRHTDTVEKIEYDLLTNRTKLIFHTAWELANRAERVKIDKAESPAGRN